MKRSLPRIALTCMVLAGSLFLLASAVSARKTNGNCKESMDECCKKKAGAEAGSKSWLHLSGQFFSSI